ncbi:MAG: hypothetical protein AAF564_20810 [Bacteroidota bacterium]
MGAGPHIENPYVGPQPFEQKDQKRFFGRDQEANELLSLVIANRMSLLYAQSGAGKTSLLNAKLFPMLVEREFEVLPVARVRGLIPESIPPDEVPNPFVLNTLISWSDKDTDLTQLTDESIGSYLSARSHPLDSTGLPAPRIIVFDQFEELFTAYPDRWRDRKGFFNQVVEALEGGPVFLQAESLTDPRGLWQTLHNTDNPLSAYLRPFFSSSMQRRLEADDMPTIADFANELNRLIRRQGLFRADQTAEASLVANTEVLLDKLPDTEAASHLHRLIRANNFATGMPVKALAFSPAVENLILSNPRGTALQKLNRMLLEAAYPQHLPKTSVGDPLLRVLFIIREDFIAQLDPYLPDLPNQLRSRLRLMRLQQRAALEAVKKPLVGTSRSFAEGVAERLVGELLKINVETEYGDVVSLKGEYVEPVQLQVVCENLWNDLPDDITEITDSHVSRFGDVNEALGAFYEATILKTVAGSGIPESTLRRFFERTLLTPAGTRGTVYRGLTETGDITNAAVDILEDRHIIRGEWRGGSRWYELTHDRFVEPILESNKNWLEKNAGTREIYNLLERKADEWTETGQEPAALLNEYDLERAERWLDRPETASLDVSDLVKEYVSNSRKALDARTIQRERGLARRYRRFLMFLVLLLVPAAIIWYNAIQAVEKADEERRNTIALADSLEEVTEGKLTRAIAIIDSLKVIADSAQIKADAVIASAQAREDSALTELYALNTRIDSANMQLKFAEAELTRAETLRVEADRYATQARRRAVQADSDREGAIEKLNQALALAIADMSRRQLSLGRASLAALLAKQAHVFDREGNNQFEGQVYEALRTSLNALSPDSTSQLGGPQTYFDHQARGQVRHVAYSPDGRWLVSGANNDFVRVRNLETNTTFNLNDARINPRCLVFSPNNDLLAVCDANGGLQLWAFTEAGPSQSVYKALPLVAQDVAFDPKGEVLALISREGWLYRWTLDSADGDIESFIHPDPVFRTLAASPTQPYLVAADRAGKLYLWENWATISETPTVVEGGQQGINTIAFAPNSRTFATGGEDYRVLLWQVSQDSNRITQLEELLGHLGPVNDLSYSRNGALLASASSDKSIHIRSTRTIERRPLILQDHDFWVWSVDIHPNNQRVASGSGDGTVRIWITTSNELVDRICQVLPGGQLTPQEWETYIGNDFDIDQYQKPCP